MLKPPSIQTSRLGRCGGPPLAGLLLSRVSSWSLPSSGCRHGGRALTRQQPVSLTCLRGSAQHVTLERARSCASAPAPPGATPVPGRGWRRLATGAIGARRPRLPSGRSATLLRSAFPLALRLDSEHVEVLALEVREERAPLRVEVAEVGSVSHIARVSHSGYQRKTLITRPAQPVSEKR